VKILFFLLIFFSSALFAEAHVPVLVSQDSLKDITHIEDPTLSQAFYGQLDGIPHTYEIVATESFKLFTQILVPDIDSSENIISGIVIKLPEERGRVTEVSRLPSKDASWESQYEPFGGDTYRQGPQFETELGPGKYRIEVHTPDNQEKYVLVVGKREEMTLGYFEFLGRLIEVKRFFEKSPIRIVESPFVYVPVGGCALLVLGWWWFRFQRKKKIHNPQHDDEEG
jgi:hypothetical protein